jgi:hypothetical protein
MDISTLKAESLQTNLNRLQLRLRWHVARLGNAGKIGIGLFVVAGIFFLAAVSPQGTELQKLQERAETLQSKPQQTNDGVTDANRKVGGDQALQIFYEFFPRIDSSPFWIRELVRIAKQQGVEINSSDFRLSIEKDERLSRYEMILPIRGRYPQIRAFIAAALEAVPAMAIVGIAFKRENVQSAQLEVRLEVNLYLDE